MTAVMAPSCGHGALTRCPSEGAAACPAHPSACRARCLHGHERTRQGDGRNAMTAKRTPAEGATGLAGRLSAFFACAVWVRSVCRAKHAPRSSRGGRAPRPRVSPVTLTGPLVAVELLFSSTFSAAAGATELMRGWKVAQKIAMLAHLMLQSGTLTAEDMRWLWGPRTVIIGSDSLGNCNYVL